MNVKLTAPQAGLLEEYFLAVAELEHARKKIIKLELKKQAKLQLFQRSFPTMTQGAVISDIILESIDSGENTLYDFISEAKENE